MTIPTETCPPASELTGLLAGLEAAAVVSAAAQLGLFDAIEADRGTTPVGLARDLDLDPVMTQRLVDALVTLGVVVQDEGRLRPGAALAPVRIHHDLWSGLAEALRTGRSVIDVARRCDAEALYGPVVATLEELNRPDRAIVADRLAGCGPSILDLGAGNAPWTRELARRDPTITVTAVDLPAVCEEMRAALASDGFSERFQIVGGSLFDVEVAGDYDLVLLAQVCRLFHARDAGRAIVRAANLLRPGGTLAVVDQIPDHERDDATSTALYQLGLALRTARGEVHALAQYRAWFRLADLSEPVCAPAANPGLVLLTAIKA